jgi:pimeloyl-ACP methyl ester carboxylesterase
MRGLAWSTLRTHDQKGPAMPTIVLVHGSFAESASWNGVIDPLAAAGHRVIAAANPLRGLADDAQAVSDLVRSLDGPVLLVGHSYGGAVITNVDAENVIGLVYVAAFAPEPGESCFTLADKFPGSSLADALQAVPRSDGKTDLTIVPERFHSQFCADVPEEQARLMCATQRPVTQEALFEPSGERSLWKEQPSWFVMAEQDRNIPVAVQRYMAERAGAQRAIEIAGASHAVGVSQPRATAALILEAAALRTAEAVG